MECPLFLCTQNNVMQSGAGVQRSGAPAESKHPLEQPARVGIPRLAWTVVSEVTWTTPISTPPYESRKSLVTNDFAVKCFRNIPPLFHARMSFL